MRPVKAIDESVPFDVVVKERERFCLKDVVLPHVVFAVSEHFTPGVAVIGLVNDLCDFGLPRHPLGVKFLEFGHNPGAVRVRDLDILDLFHGSDTPDGAEAQCPASAARGFLYVGYMLLLGGFIFARIATVCCCDRMFNLCPRCRINLLH